MKKILKNIFRRAVCFANTAQDEEADLIVTTAANEELKSGVDRILLAPYGDFKNVKGMQRFQKADAQAVVLEFNSLLNTPARKIGAPIYIGHPDHEHFRDVYKDKRAYGRVKSLEAAEEGLFANVSWSKSGKELLAEEMFSSPSINWRMKYDAREGVWRPFSLKSVGLTNEPNIPVPVITAANEEVNTMDRKKLIAQLKMKADATDDQIEAAITGLQNQSTTLAANEQLEAALETERQGKTSAESRAASAQARVSTAEENFANERQERTALLIASALAAKKITPAEKTQWEADFANEFDGTLEKFNKLPSKLKTEMRSAGLGQRNAGDGERRDKIQEFVNERMDKQHEDYTTAYKNVKRSKPELFAEGTTGQ